MSIKTEAIVVAAGRITMALGGLCAGAVATMDVMADNHVLPLWVSVPYIIAASWLTWCMLDALFGGRAKGGAR